MNSLDASLMEGVRNLGTAFHGARQVCQDLAATRAETSRLRDVLVRERAARSRNDDPRRWIERCARHLRVLSPSLTGERAERLALGLSSVTALREMSPERAAFEIHVPGLHEPRVR